jgi:hypothetical protein
MLVHIQAGAGQHNHQFGHRRRTGVESRDEWCFDFHVHAAEPIARRLMDDLLCVEAIVWAEARHLGVGGGFRPASPEADGAARC